MQLGFSTNLTQFRIITNEDDVKLKIAGTKTMQEHRTTVLNK